MPRPTHPSFRLPIFNFCLKKNRTEFLLVKKIQSVFGIAFCRLDSNPIREFDMMEYSGRIKPERNKLFLSKFFEMKTLLVGTFFLIQQQWNQQHHLLNRK